MRRVESSARVSEAVRIRGQFRAVMPAAALGAVLLFAWECLVRSSAVSAFFLPAPDALGHAFATAVLHGSLLDYTAVTLRESLAGVVVGIVAAVPLGYLIARSRIAARALQPYLAATQAGLTLSVTGAVVGEFVMGGNGLGELLAVQRNSADTIGMFATLLMLSLLAVGLYGAMRLVERRLEV